MITWWVFAVSPWLLQKGSTFEAKQRALDALTERLTQLETQAVEWLKSRKSRKPMETACGFGVAWEVLHRNEGKWQHMATLCNMSIMWPQAVNSIDSSKVWLWVRSTFVKFGFAMIYAKFTRLGNLGPYCRPLPCSQHQWQACHQAWPPLKSQVISQFIRFIRFIRFDWVRNCETIETPGFPWFASIPIGLKISLWTAKCFVPVRFCRGSCRDQFIDSKCQKHMIRTCEETGWKSKVDLKTRVALLVALVARGLAAAPAVPNLGCTSFAVDSVQQTVQQTKLTHLGHAPVQCASILFRSAKEERNQEGPAVLECSWVFMSVLWFLNVLNSSWGFNFGSCLEYSWFNSFPQWFVVGPANCMDMSNEDKSKYWCRRLRKLYIFSFLFLKHFHFHHYLLFIYNCAQYAQYASAQEGELPSQEEVRAMFEKVRVPGWPWSWWSWDCDTRCWPHGCHMGATFYFHWFPSFPSFPSFNHHFHHFHQPSSDLPDLSWFDLNRFITDS